MSEFLATLRLTRVELQRSRLPQAALIVIIAVCTIALFAGSLSFDAANEIAVDLGLAGFALLTAGLAILLGIDAGDGALARRFHPLLASGLPRSTLIGARLVAALGAAAIFAAVAPLTLRLALALAGRSTGLLPEIRAAAILLPLEAVLLVSISTALSLILTRPMALALSVTIWLVCHLHPDPLTFVIVYPGWGGRGLELLGRFLPDLEFYNPLVHGVVLRESIGRAVLQAAIWTCLASTAALAVFNRKDLT
jgi:hypothetical protein